MSPGTSATCARGPHVLGANLSCWWCRLYNASTASHVNAALPVGRQEPAERRAARKEWAS